MVEELDFMPSDIHGWVSLYSQKPVLPYVADLLSMNTQMKWTASLACPKLPKTIYSFKEQIRIQIKLTGKPVERSD